jgi:type IV secretion system protein VirD4
LVRIIGAAGDERAGEVLFLLDEASALGSLVAVEEALVRGRSAGVRMLLAYQSDSQVRTAFKDKPTLLYDNCTTQIYLGASSIETAERISKSLGDWTQVLEGYGENSSRSWNEGGNAPNQGTQVNRGNSFNYSVNGRALLRPEEVLGLSDEYLIAFQRGIAPILARRIKYYEEQSSEPAAVNTWRILGWGVMVAALLLGVWLSMNGY